MDRRAAPLALAIALGIALGGSPAACGDDAGDSGAGDADGTAGDGGPSDGGPSDAAPPDGGDAGARLDAAVGECAPSGGCDTGPACADTCCASGEACVEGECRCGGSPACEVGLTCATAGPVGEGSCGVICCGQGVPCPK